MRSNRIRLFAAAVLTVLALSSGAVVAAPRADEPPPDRPIYDFDQLEPLPNFESGGSAQAYDAVNPTSLVPASRVTYQSYRDNNWEIYVTSANGSAHNRLTNNSNVDVNPRLNRGNTRIVFASDRDGKAEIYVMNVDGSGQTRLTWNDAVDNEPIWSPDGSRIAFASDRDGKAEIYVMNANGTGQTRLTFDGDFNASPAWSPDGSQIAFVSYRNGGYRIWTMNANGSNQTQRSSQPYSNNPTWSPDGSQIAYDSDGDNDGWQDVWVMQADGGNQHVVQGHLPNEDVLANSWSPEGRFIIYTQVSYIQFQGNWYWTQAIVNSHDFADLPSGVVSNSDTDWNGDWGTSDLIVPFSNMRALPLYVKNPVLLTWSSSDAGGGGISNYDVQYRALPNGPWTTHQNFVSSMSTTFSGLPGQTYGFRVRARDWGGNVEAWSESVEAQTTPYLWRLTGGLHDNVGNPIAGATFQANPTLVYSLPTSNAGQFSAYAGTANTQTITLKKPGYGALPTMIYSGSQDIQQSFYLPPLDNVVANGNFEAPTTAAPTQQAGIAAWEVFGSPLPQMVANPAASGTQAVRLGQPETPLPNQEIVATGCGDMGTDSALAFDAGGQLNFLYSCDGKYLWNTRRYYASQWIDHHPLGEATFIFDPQLFSLSTGDLVAIWVEAHDDPGPIQMYSAYRTLAGDWSASVPITGTTAQPNHLSAARFTDNSLHVSWTSFLDGHIRYSRRSAAGVWAAPELVSTEPADNTSISSLSLGADGKIHVVWPDSGVIYYRERSTGGTWQSVIPLTDPGDVGAHPTVTVGPNGALLAVWQQITGGSGEPEIVFAERPSGGSWSAAIPISTGAAAALQPRLVVGSNGTVHVFWESPSTCELIYAGRTPASQWTEPEVLGACTGFDWLLPSYTVDGASRLHLLWPAGSNMSYRAGSLGPDGLTGATTTLMGLWTGNYSSDVVTGADNTAHLIWTTYGATYYQHVTSDLGTDVSRLTQVISLPPTMTAPYLAFMLQHIPDTAVSSAASASETPSSGFRVWVDDGELETQAFVQMGAVPTWNQYSVSLLPWAGKTITISFELAVPPGSYPLAYLDDISIGQAHPDIWVAADGPSQSLPSLTHRFALTYGNRSVISSTSVVLTYSLPTPLTFVAASVPPASTNPLVWNLGTLPAHSGPTTIAITATVAPTATRGVELPLVALITGTYEIETANNTVQALLWIGQRLFLPLIMR